MGKRDAIAEAGRPTTKTLRPDLDESVDFENSENIFITGDNLEVLKILQESYLGKIDMIYIDPPYNTGKDFVYSDKFQQSEEELEEAMDLRDEEGRQRVGLTKNERSSARYHSDWLNMMYPRLVLARNLLKDSGVIFISIDDNEQANLKTMCDEVFGEENFVNDFTWVNNLTGRQISGVGAAKTNESILCYAKNITITKEFLVDVEFVKQYLPSSYLGFKFKIYEDDYGSYKIGDTLYNHNRLFNEETRKNLVYSIYYDTLHNKFYPEGYEPKNKELIEIKPHKNGDGIHKYHAWRWSKEKVINEQYNLFADKKKNGEYELYTKIRNYNITTLKDIITNISNGDAEVTTLFNGTKVFDYPKPVLLLQLIISIFESSSLILDFFAGSATTAHAVMQLNAEDGGNRKYILCTLDEEVAAKSAAKKAGYETIDQIARERIRRAAAKIQEEHPERVGQQDFGFKAFKVDKSNFKNISKTPGDYQQGDLFDSVSNIKEDRTDLDLLFQIMLAWGMELSLTIQKSDIDGVPIYNVADGALIACFSDDLQEDTIRQIAEQEPLRAIFKDSSFANSSAKINLSEIFKEVSPLTKVKVV